MNKTPDSIPLIQGHDVLPTPLTSYLECAPRTAAGRKRVTPRLLPLDFPGVVPGGILALEVLL